MYYTPKQLIQPGQLLDCGVVFVTTSKTVDLSASPPSSSIYSRMWLLTTEADWLQRAVNKVHHLPELFFIIFAIILFCVFWFTWSVSGAHVSTSDAVAREPLGRSLSTDPPTRPSAAPCH